MRPILVGQAPGPRTDPELPLFPVPSTSSGGRLCEMMGITRGQYLGMFDRVNLLYNFPGKHKRDDKFPMREARIAACAMRPLFAGRVVILIGRNVAEAFGVEAEFHTWFAWPVRRPNLIQRCNGVAQAAVVPHPSGRNHWYNRPEHRALARAFWQNLLAHQSQAILADRKLLSSSPEGERVEVEAA